ncbi:diguanylate cyclase [Nitrosomonas cryotolerans]|uniref:diguanylate cyclase n=1 Tax=Nitrosomonas cryotolerans ATCC 49181 TaxID=1131553 RepID=A0A1N6I6N6_9PROT|nr:GGDEF domain-containing protein [Nitrosomonas cryotolerans]SFP91183.1 diguanylate cyclase [Nitrosomonas cryotolerans]SIO27629.1 diguanylate cyclase [Nitrosomonas cryotolerans ATCC 49181]
MSDDSNSCAIARETLRQLALLKISPTPDNYHRLYHEIAGHSANRMCLNTAEMLSEIAAELPHNTPESLHCANRLRQAVNDKDWYQYKATLINLIEMTVVSGVISKPPDSVIPGPDGARTSVHEQMKVEDTDNGSLLLSQSDPVENSRLSAHLQKFMVQILEHIATMQLGDTVLTDEARFLALQVWKVNDQQETNEFIMRFQQFCIHFESCGENAIKLQRGLLRLINLLMDSTSELLVDDQWVKNQLAKLRTTMATPLSLQIVEQAEHQLEAMMRKQDIIKDHLSKAKTALKQMVTYLIDSIEELSNTTNGYQDKIEYYSEKTGQIDNIEELNELLVEMMRDTKQIQANVLSSRNDFLAVRAEVDMAQNKISQLESELRQMGEKVHQDHLTGILNRRGLDIAFKRESSRAKRHQIPLCLALLDIDNFKRLNDTYGHKVGDDALIYLVEAVKDTTRPDDVIARFGGEEFVILLPNTDLEKAITVLSRIQRNLTKKFFLHENKRLLITFSAGVAEYQAGELQQNMMMRADAAMYRAKNNGKNQIVADTG